jgi:hypothetical protein
MLYDNISMVKIFLPQTTGPLSLRLKPGPGKKYYREKEGLPKKETLPVPLQIWYGLNKFGGR